MSVAYVPFRAPLDGAEALAGLGLCDDPACVCRMSSLAPAPAGYHDGAGCCGADLDAAPGRAAPPRGHCPRCGGTLPANRACCGQYWPR